MYTHRTASPAPESDPAIMVEAGPLTLRSTSALVIATRVVESMFTNP